MGYGSRILLHRDGQLFRIPLAKYLRFWDGQDRVFPEYAGEDLEFGEFDVCVERRQPVDILQRHYFRMRVTRTGGIDQDFKESSLRYSVDRAPLLIATPQAAVGEEEAAPAPSPADPRFTWQPSPELELRMMQLVLDGRKKTRRRKASDARSSAPEGHSGPGSP